ncbi:Phosphatidylinositol transfer protein CSR1 [Tetrabaena socialis]|uniref:Phosphatidylinositol transfer protein CSR1 n=1 Tax=Tetrabaena socialis TaxID=47790 RepID=A0A2J7ZU86_9CHLO|nr:Phosphatidylinositol transfer protein CSR1 [Tetrabaena socialis]|eukprot:PNH03837.1 Phosphatidylinositol transfer protein CSR1 [Tetrabaena socialis]
MLSKHIEWRRSAGLPVAETAHGVQVNLEHKKVFLQGLDKTGRPIVLGVGARHRRFDSKEDAMQFCTYALDTAVAIGWVKKYIDSCASTKPHRGEWVTGRGGGGRDPERLGRLFLYEAPMAFYAIWRAVSPFVDPVTKTKINFVFAKQAHDEFAKVFDLQLLPRDMGGEGDYLPINEAHHQAVARAAARSSPDPSNASGNGAPAPLLPPPAGEALPEAPAGLAAA